jgi:hypothetical protein
MNMYNETEESLELPGPWIDHPDRDWAFLVQMLFDEILDQLSEARIVLHLFKEKSELASQTTKVDQQLRQIYAKSFVYALDTITQIIRILEKQEQLSKAARIHCQKFLSQFGELRELRNSLQHIEDRLRGIGRDRRPIPSTLLVIGAFRENSFYGAITSDGHYVEIEISDSVLTDAYSIIKDLIWCFNWLGPGEVQLERPETDA